MLFLSMTSPNAVWCAVVAVALLCCPATAAPGACMLPAPIKELDEVDAVIVVQVFTPEHLFMLPKPVPSRKNNLLSVGSVN